jgi:hypothetical protein
VEPPQCFSKESTFVNGVKELVWKSEAKHVRLRQINLACLSGGNFPHLESLQARATLSHIPKFTSENLQVYYLEFHKRMIFKDTKLFPYLKSLIHLF